VRGTVSDTYGRALDGATVVLLDASSRLQIYGTATGSDGTFLLERVRPGAYLLAATYLGYAGSQQKISVESGKAIVVPMHLSDTAIPQPEVVITETRAKKQLTPITFSNLTKADLENQPAMKDLPVHLASMPSVTYYSENGNGIGYGYIRMRGFGQRRLAVSVNGVPQNDPEEANVFWIDFFDLQGAIDDIQVQRGAGSSMYGPTAIGGAINIVARPYKAYPYARVESGAGAFGTRQFTVEANTGLLSDRYAVFGRFSRLVSYGYRDWSWTRFWRGFLGITRYGAHSTLTLQAYGGPQTDGLAFSGIPKGANKATIDDGFGGMIDRRYNLSSFSRDREHFNQPHVELLHKWKFAPNWIFNQSVFWIRGIGYFDFDGSFRSANYLRLPAGTVPVAQRQDPLFVSKPDASILFRADLNQWQLGWQPSITHKQAAGETTIGAELRLHRSKRWGRIQKAKGLPEALVGSENDVRVYSFRGEKIIGSIFARHFARPISHLALQADMQFTYRRYRIYDEHFFDHRFKVPYVFFNPRLGVTINPEQPWSVYGSVALASREPRMKSLYDGEEAGDGFQPQFRRGPDNTFDYDHPIVKPEHLLDVELGSTLARARYHITGNVFWMEFRDEIIPSGGLDQFGVPRTGNADRTRHIGLELEAATRILPGLDVSGNATFSRNRFIRFTEFVTSSDFSTTAVRRDGNPIAGFPEQTANLGISYQWRGLVMSVHARMAGKQYIDNAGGIGADGNRLPDLVVDPYTLVDASVRYAFARSSAMDGLAVSVDVNNVFNDEVLLFGNVGFGTPQFFPTATRHVFARLRYTLR